MSETPQGERPHSTVTQLHPPPTSISDYTPPTGVRSVSWQSESGYAEWFGIFTIDWPGKVQKHPRLFNLVDEQLEKRTCSFSVGIEALRLTCELQGSDREAADVDARDVAEHILGILGLRGAALTDVLLVHLDRNTTSAKPHLSLISDLPS